VAIGKIKLLILVLVRIKFIHSTMCCLFVYCNTNLLSVLYTSD